MTEPTTPQTPAAGQPSTTPELEPLHPAATGFTLFRCLPNGNGRAYSSVEYDHGWTGANRFWRQLRFFGFIKPSSAAPSDAYGILDVLNKNGDIVQDYDVPTAQAFQFIKRKLKLTVVPDSEDEIRALLAAVAGESR